MLSKTRIFLHFLKASTLIFLSLIVYGNNSVNSGSGLIMTPSARLAEEGTVKLIISQYSPINRIAVVANPYEWLEASFYYNDINVKEYFPGSSQSYKDKGFSFKVRLNEESDYLPAVALGFDDIAGTSIFKSEYIVMNKAFGSFDISLGYGFGALGSRDSINNIFRSGERSTWDFSTGGELNTKDLFKGDAALFGGITFNLPLFLGSQLVLEYDSDDYSSYYELVPRYIEYEPESEVNYGFKTKIDDNFTLSLGYIKGNQLSVSLESKINIANSPQKNFSIERKSKRSEYIAIMEDLRDRFIFVQNMDIDHQNKKIALTYAQASYHSQARIAKVIKDYLRNEFGSREYEVSITSMNGAYDLSEIGFSPFSETPKFRSYKPRKYAFNPKIKYPVTSFALNPILTTHIGSPSGFFYGALEAQLVSEIAINRNFQLNSSFSINVADNFDDMFYNSNPTDLYPVRTDIQEYLREGKKGFDEFSINYFKNFEDQNFLQISLGHFERMYSGVHLEFLKRPIDKIFSYGFELSNVRQREYSRSFTKFKDFQTTIGHFNFYAYEPRNKILAHFSAGKYLAGDKGYTLDLSRYFNNGARLGFFFTRTNASKESFGEGSFDKGFYVKYPLSIFDANKNSRSFSGYTYRPITRDGGAKLNFPRSLFDLTKDAQAIELITSK